MNRLTSAFCSAALLILGGSGLSAADGADFARRVAAAESDESGDPRAALRRLDDLVVEAMQTGQPERQLSALEAHARLSLRAGAPDAAAESLERARQTAAHYAITSHDALLALLEAAIAWEEGEADLAVAWLERAFQLALASSPPQRDTARESLLRLRDLHQALGQPERAAQAEAWLDLLDGRDETDAGVHLQPRRMQTVVAIDEVGRARLVLANATLQPVSGTLLLDAPGLLVRGWQSHGGGEWLVLGLPTGSSAANLPQGKKITLLPGESRAVTLELEPAQPARLAQEKVRLTWQAEGATLTADLAFHLVNPSLLNDPGVANASHLRLSRHLSLPVYEEIYLRRPSHGRVENFLAAASSPARIEIHEIGQSGGLESRTLLAVDAEGDGDFRGPRDQLLSDQDGDGFPDVAFDPDKPVAALELRLFPLPGQPPAELDLSLSLREDAAWRQPADATNRVEAPEPRSLRPGPPPAPPAGRGPAPRALPPVPPAPPAAR